jgi:hypothetical protein
VTEKFKITQDSKLFDVIQDAETYLRLNEEIEKRLRSEKEISKMTADEMKPLGRVVQAPNELTAVFLKQIARLEVALGLCPKQERQELVWRLSKQMYGERRAPLVLTSHFLWVLKRVKATHGKRRKQKPSSR